ncbi:MAG: tripartite tricarboxylate transporter substrate binding protein [Betaproteobacteria bacterium]|nr:tripartite tricarboxylate transporter substrate binding protein [Betaproteobacteria bacterium]
MKRTIVLTLLAALAGAPSFGVAQAQWPERTITLLVPFPPGGGLDITARQIAPLLSKELGQAVVVENRAGATGSIGASAVAKAPPDGYLLLWSSLTSHAIHVSLYGASVPYNLETNFTPVVVFGTIPLVFVVNPAVKANNLSELIALAKAKPGALAFASGGNGSVQHLAGEMFKRMAGVDMLHVPYKGIGPAMNDLIGGQVNLAIESLAATQPHIRSGRLRALAVASAQRVATIPDVPTSAESGLQGFDVPVNLFLMATAATPAAVVARLNGAMKTVLGRPEFRDNLQAQAVVATYQPPEQAAQLVREELAKWGRVIREAGIKPE